MTKPELVSWGRYPYSPQYKHNVNWRDNIVSTLQFVTSNYQETLPFGNGRSYGDSCLATSNHLIALRSLNRFIAFDKVNGLITAESGATLEEILNLIIPHGWFLPVTPGTKFVTLGGAIANDVHGKNHHVRGTFGRHIKQFGIIRSDNPYLICSPDSNGELFNATIGGLGITGVIAWAEIKLVPIVSSQMTTLTVRFDDLDEFISLSDELDHQHEYSVAWVDCAAKGRATGRGIFMVGDHCKSGELFVHNSRKLNVPLTPPISLINQLTLKAFNSMYYGKTMTGRVYGKSDYDPFFYPLDGINNWNRIYGRKGFQQYQCVIPSTNARDAIYELLKVISRSGNGSFLAVLKRCGDVQSPGLLSFPLPGISLALDFAQSSSLNQLFAQLDEIVRSAKGRLYPAKDAHMSAVDFQCFYPNWIDLQKFKDPHICSHFWKRVSTP